jgi:hypothetical protein
MLFRVISHQFIRTDTRFAGSIFINPASFKINSLDDQLREGGAATLLCVAVNDDNIVYEDTQYNSKITASMVFKYQALRHPWMGGSMLPLSPSQDKPSQQIVNDVENIGKPGLVIAVENDTTVLRWDASEEGNAAAWRKLNAIVYWPEKQLQCIVEEERAAEEAGLAESSLAPNRLSIHGLSQTDSSDLEAIELTEGAPQSDNAEAMTPAPSNTALAPRTSIRNLEEFSADMESDDADAVPDVNDLDDVAPDLPDAPPSDSQLTELASDNQHEVPKESDGKKRWKQVGTFSRHSLKMAKFGVVKRTSLKSHAAPPSGANALDC